MNEEERIRAIEMGPNYSPLNIRYNNPSGSFLLTPNTSKPTTPQKNITIDPEELKRYMKEQKDQREREKKEAKESAKEKGFRVSRG